MVHPRKSCIWVRICPIARHGAHDVFEYRNISLQHEFHQSSLVKCVGLISTIPTMPNVLWGYYNLDYDIVSGGNDISWRLVIMTQIIIIIVSQVWIPDETVLG